MTQDVDVDVDSGVGMGTDTDTNKHNNIFLGRTIYGSKLKKLNNTKRLNCVMLYFRVIMVMSIATLSCIATVLAVKVNELRSENEILKATSSVNCSLFDEIGLSGPTGEGSVSESCQGLWYQGKCLTLASGPSNFQMAKQDCESRSQKLPSKNLLGTWLKDFLEGTWGEDGKELTSSMSSLTSTLSLDTSSEIRKHYCVS